MADKIAVLIPCYNESKSITKVVKDMKAVLPDAVIYVYDNNSTDGTDKLAREAGAVVLLCTATGKGQCNPNDVSGDRCELLPDGGRR